MQIRAEPHKVDQILRSESLKNQEENMTKVNQMQEPKVRWKLFKSGKLWVSAAITISAVGLSQAVLSGNVVKADTEDPAANQSTTADTTSTTGNTATLQSSAKDADDTNPTTDDTTGDSSNTETTTSDSVKEQAAANAKDTSVDSSAVTEAAAAAKGSGVKVTQGETKQVTAKSNSDEDVAAAKKQIADDYAKQTTALETAKTTQDKNNATYAAAEKAYQAELADPELTTNQTEWSKDTINKFLNSTPNVVYISGDPGMTAKLLSGTRLTTARINAINANAAIPYPEATDPKQQIVTKMTVGASMRYNNALTDPTTGKKIDVVLKVTSIAGANTKTASYLRWSTNRIGVTEWFLGKAGVADDINLGFDLLFYKQGTNTPIKINALTGIADVDANQFVTMNTAGSTKLVGSALTQKGNTVSSGRGSSEAEDASNQVWFLNKGVSKISIHFGAKYVPSVNMYDDSYFAFGAVQFAAKIPVAPIKKVETASYALSELVVNPSTPGKTADNEGKTLIAGDTSTQHITQDTGVNADKSEWYVGDAIFKTEDGRLPVSYKLSDFTVTDSEGNDVTADGKFVESDETVAGKAAHVIKWVPTDTSKLTSSSYTLNTKLTTVADKVADTELDAGVSPYGTTDLHDYKEYVPNTSKNWTEGSQVVNGQIYVDGDVVTGSLTMSLPDPSSLSQKLSKVEVQDNYSDFKDKVDFVSAEVLENGKDATAEYTILNDSATGKVTATRKNAANTPAGDVTINAKFKIHSDVPSGTELSNGGSGTINGERIPVPNVPVVTYTPDPKKDWVLDGKNTTNKTYLVGDTAYAEVTGALPDASKLAQKLSHVSITDNYSNFKDKADVLAVMVLEGNKDVSSEYTVNISVADGTVTATRKDPSTTPSGVLKLRTAFKIHKDVKNATALMNGGSMTVNTQTVPTPDVPITVWTPDPKKDVEIGEVSGDTDATANTEMLSKGQTVTYPLTSDTLPADRVDDITSRQYTDSLPEGTSYQGFQAWIKEADGTLTDVTEHITAKVSGQTVVFTEDQTLLDRYNQDKSVAVTTPIIDLFAKTTKDNAKLVNDYTLMTNDFDVVSNKVTNYTPNPDPVKTEINSKGTTINGKKVLPGSVNSYVLTWDLSQYKGINATDDQIAKGFGFVEDIPEEALDPQLDQFSYADSDGKSVTGLTAAVYKSLSAAPAEVQAIVKNAGISPKGAFIYVAVADAKAFYDTYVTTGKDIKLTMPMTVIAKAGTTYSNTAYEIDFGNGYTTETVTNNVPKMDPKKDVVVSVDNQKSLNNSNIKLGTTFDYKLSGAVIDAGNGDPVTEYGFSDDYDQKHDQYNGQYQVFLTKDVTLTDGTVLKKGTEVSKYTSQTIDSKTGKVTIEFKSDFLQRVDAEKTGFGADAFIQMKRIASGNVYNAYTNTINGVGYKSNRVHTFTPEPAAPGAPKTPATPAEAAALPTTGDTSEASVTVAGAVLIAALGSAGALKLKRRERK